MAAAVVAAGAAVATAVAVIVLPGRPPGGAFPRLVPAAAPAGWQHRALPNGTAVLSYPPSLRPLAGDADAVSAALPGPGGRVEVYLNATPRQGAENLRHWPAFRLRLLRSDDAVSASQVAAAQHVRFRGGTGSCVIDRYVTRIGHHSYEEIACLVQGHTRASVIVAAAAANRWAQARPMLLRAVAAYRVN